MSVEIGANEIDASQLGDDIPTNTREVFEGGNLHLLKDQLNTGLELVLSKLKQGGLNGVENGYLFSSDWQVTDVDGKPFNDQRVLSAMQTALLSLDVVNSDDFDPSVKKGGPVERIRVSQPMFAKPSNRPANVSVRAETWLIPNPEDESRSIMKWPIQGPRQDSISFRLEVDENGVVRYGRSRVRSSTSMFEVFDMLVFDPSKSDGERWSVEIAKSEGMNIVG